MTIRKPGELCLETKLKITRKPNSLEAKYLKKNGGWFKTFAQHRMHYLSYSNPILQNYISKTTTTVELNSNSKATFLFVKSVNDVAYQPAILPLTMMIFWEII